MLDQRHRRVARMGEPSQQLPDECGDRSSHPLIAYENLGGIYNDPNVTESGQLLLRIAERLGVADQVKAKSQVVAPGASVSMLAKDTSPGIVIALSVLPSRPGEFHPEPLTDPDLILSHHPARATISSI